MTARTSLPVLSQRATPHRGADFSVHHWDEVGADSLSRTSVSEATLAFTGEACL